MNAGDEFLQTFKISNKLSSFLNGQDGNYGSMDSITSFIDREVLLCIDVEWQLKNEDALFISPWYCHLPIQPSNDSKYTFIDAIYGRKYKSFQPSLNPKFESSKVDNSNEAGVHFVITIPEVVKRGEIFSASVCIINKSDMDHDFLIWKHNKIRKEYLNSTIPTAHNGYRLELKGI